MSSEYFKSLLDQLPEPKAVFKHFFEVNQVPRGSNPTQDNLENCDKIIAAISKWTKDMGYDPIVLPSKNMVIRKPASKGCENLPGVCLQVHMDMVCQKNEGVEIDFKTQGVTPYIDGDYIKAKGTSLGADDGIGIAIVMAILEDKTLIHPPLEVLVTRDEEVGLFGANALESDVLKSKYLINVDSEEEKSVCIGCAGSFSLKIEAPFKRIPKREDLKFKEIRLNKFRGGHTGVDADKGRANPIMMLGRLLKRCESMNFVINEIECGTARNSIPRSGRTVVGVKAENSEAFNDILLKEFNNIKEEYKTTDGDMEIEIKEIAENIFNPVGVSESIKLINFLNHIPFGIVRFSPDLKGLVETSMTVAVIKTLNDHFEMIGSCRSSRNSQLDWMYSRLHSVCDMCGYKLHERIGSYPGWLSDANSKLNKIIIEESTKVYGSKPKVYSIHAGLECGIIKNKYDDMDCSSIGPEVNNAHSPEERVKISSVLPCYQTLVGSLKELAKN